MLSISPDARDIQGRILTPEDPGYDAARTVFLGDVDRRARRSIARVADAADVAARHRASPATAASELAVRSGGHSPAGHGRQSTTASCSTCRGHEASLDDRRSRAAPPGPETGLTAGEYTAAAAAHGLATGFGDAGSVGIGGITLSGGVGFLVREHGMTIDQLLAAEIVTADGRVPARSTPSGTPTCSGRCAAAAATSASSRGCKYQLHERLQSHRRHRSSCPASADVIDRVPRRGGGRAGRALHDRQRDGRPADAVPARPRCTAGRSSLAMLAWTGDADAGERALAPFRALAEPLADMVRPMPYTEHVPAQPIPTTTRSRPPAPGSRSGRRRRRPWSSWIADAPGRRRAAARARRRDGARAGRRDRLRPPGRATDRQRRRDVRRSPADAPGGTRRRSPTLGKRI